jgi:hypothetical protein
MVWPFMVFCSCSWSSSSFVWCFFGVFAGLIFSLSIHEEGPGAARSTVCSSPARQTIAPPVVSAPLPRRVQGQCLRMSRPWREVKSRRGAPKRVNTEGYACPNQGCSSFGITEAQIHALVGDGKHGPVERIQTFRCQACRTTFSARRDTPLYRLKTPSRAGSQWYSLRWLKGWILQQLNGSSATDKRPSLRGCRVLANMRRPCTSTLSAPSSSRTYSWMNCEHGSAAVDRCSGSGWPLTPAPSFFPCLSSVPAPKPWPIGSSTRSDRAWPPFCIPLLTSDGLNLYFSALTAHFGQWLPLGRRGRKVLRWQVAAGLIYGQVKKSYRRRQLVRVMPVMRLLTQADLSVALQAMGFSGRLNTATISRLNLTVRHGVAALARRTWATAQQSPQLLANLEGWRASSPLVRPHHSLRLALVQPRERGGRLLAQRYRQRTPALAVGRTNRRWTACEVLSYPLPPVCA